MKRIACLLAGIFATAAGFAGAQTEAELKALSIFDKVFAKAGGDSRLAEFMDWDLRQDFSCGPTNGATPSQGLRLIKPNKRIGNQTRLRLEDFYYDAKASARMCVDASPTIKASLYRPDLIDVWRKAGSPEAKIDPSFGDGSMIAAPIFAQIPPFSHSPVKMTIMIVKDGLKKHVDYYVNLPASVPANAADLNVCPTKPYGSLQAPPPKSRPDSISLDEFYWLQVRKPAVNPDNYPGKCGDVLVLVGVNLMAKEVNAGSSTDRWLWSAVWWAKDDPDPNHHLAAIAGTPASSPAAWKNYVFRAVYGKQQEIFNPNKHGEAEGTNCERCHVRKAIFPMGALAAEPRLDADSVFAGPIRPHF